MRNLYIYIRNKKIKLQKHLHTQVKLREIVWNYKLQICLDQQFAAVKWKIVCTYAAVLQNIYIQPHGESHTKTDEITRHHHIHIHTHTHPNINRHKIELETEQVQVQVQCHQQLHIEWYHPPPKRSKPSHSRYEVSAYTFSHLQGHFKCTHFTI